MVSRNDVLYVTRSPTPGKRCPSGAGIFLPWHARTARAWNCISPSQGIGKTTMLSNEARTRWVRTPSFVNFVATPGQLVTQLINVDRVATKMKRRIKRSYHAKLQAIVPWASWVKLYCREEMSAIVIWVCEATFFEPQDAKCSFHEFRGNVSGQVTREKHRVIAH